MHPFEQVALARQMWVLLQSLWSSLLTSVSPQIHRLLPLSPTALVVSHRTWRRRLLFSPQSRIS